MTISHLFSGLIILIIGIILSYYFLPNTKDDAKKQSIIKKILCSIGSIFILIGLLGILTFCLGIDGGNYTIEKEDDMNILNGIVIGICILSLEKNIIYYLRKIKNAH